MRVGFVALTDAAPLIVAEQLGLYRERGLQVSLHKQASWPAVRDALLADELDAAHCLFSLPLSVALGVSGRQEQSLIVAMVLNANGQAVTLGLPLAEGAGRDPAAAMAGVAAYHRRRPLTLAVTYPGGTHDVWLRYWLAAAGIDPAEVGIIPIPPAQMVANLRGGTMDGFSAGEPWSALAVMVGAGFTAAGSHQILPGHPEKALVVTEAALRRERGQVRELMGATLNACRWLDVEENRPQAAQMLAAPHYVNAPAGVIAERLSGPFELGAHLGVARLSWSERVRFHDGGRVNAPSRGSALWFIAQFRRLGLLRGGDSRDRQIVERLIARELYEEVARGEGIPISEPDMQRFSVPLDGATFDPAEPRLEAARPITGR
ncbi:MAG: ABC transporter substrate-binding protein [Thermoleophilia bacterium]|nr:ABC transporter substrate-binding protein [Thermoleophilia bacterium]